MNYPGILIQYNLAALEPMLGSECYLFESTICGSLVQVSLTLGATLKK